MHFEFIRRTATCVLACLSLFAQPAELGEPPVAPNISFSSKSFRLSAGVAPSAASDWYAISNRETVRNAYLSVFAPTTDTPLAYTGDPGNGSPGDTSSAYKAAVLKRVNFMRAMAGVPSVPVLDPVWTGKAQKGALMLYANKALSHTPPASWLRYTTEGAEALGKSNLCQGSAADPGCVHAYMDDFGSSNAPLGHRRWLLYPQTQRMATGDIPDPTWLWNVLWVIDDSTYGTQRPATREPYVAWPPAGYVPYQLLFNRWHFSHPGATFGGASVSVTRNGSPLSVRIDAADGPNYGENSIVFVPGNPNTNFPTVPAKPGEDTTYHVVISNAIVNNAPVKFEYDVIVFDPAVAGLPPAGPGTPAVISLTPESGAGYTGTFTATFQQSSNNHYLGYMLFLSTPNVVNYTATGSCLVEFNKYSNGVRLIDNAGTGWLGPASGVPISPAAVTLTNNQCSVDVRNVVANVSGNTMTVTVPVTFLQAIGPVLGTFLQAQDSNGVWTGMTQFGNWTLPGAPQNRLGPSVTAVASSATTGRQSTYTITASHTEGPSSLEMIHLLASARIVGSPACQIVYFPGANHLNLINDRGTALVSPSGVTPGSPGTLSNSRCSLNTGLASRTVLGNSMRFVLPVTYSEAFAGQKNVYVNAFDNAGLLSHWVIGSTMMVQ